MDAFEFLNHPSAHQKGGVCNAKYPKSWIVNIAAQMISIRIKARALNLITPPQRVRTIPLGEALMGRCLFFEMLTSFFRRLLPREHRLSHSAPFRHGSQR